MRGRGAPLALPDLREAEVQVHHVPLTGPAPFVAEEHLSPAERQRAAAFLSAPARQHFVTVRCALRVLLARHLQVAPGAVPLTRTHNGKPALEDGVGRLSFSVTHTDGLALLALMRGHPLGVDAERVCPRADLRAVAQGFFTPAEHATLAALPDPLWLPAFYRVWTRREAALKTTGAGLAGQVEVSASDAPRGWLIAADGAAAGGWLSLDLGVPKGLQAALVVQGGAGLRVREVPWR